MAGRQPILIFSSNTERESGRKVQMANVAAAKAVADIVRTSLGPNSMLKMLLNPTGGITVTNDGNAILREIDVSHPSAKSMIELSRTQDEEVGDGTTSVIILAGELLSLAAPWIEKNLHPSVIIQAYQAALDDALVHLNRIALPLDLSNREQLLGVVSSVVGTKFSREEFLCNFALDAVSTCLVESEDGRKDIDLKRYCRVERIPGGELMDSQLVRGVVLNKDITHSNMRRRIENPRVIILDCALEYQKLETKTNVIVEKNEDLKKLIQLEEEFVINMCNQICKFKPDLVITEKGLSDLAQHIFLKHNITALRRTKKTDNNRIARTTGATVVNDPNDLQESDVGTATLFEIRKIGDEYFTFIINEKNAKACTIVLRGGSKDVLNEMERTLQDALQVARNVYLEPKLLYGGGAAEMSIAAHLSEKSKQVEGVRQWPYRSAAIAFEVIPRTLALNCGANIIKLLTELRAKHASSLLENSCWGVDGRKGTIVDMKTIPVFDSYAVKVQTIKTAFEAATLLLRVDDIFSGLKKKERTGSFPQDDPGMD